MGALFRAGPSQSTMWSFMNSGVILSFVNAASRGNSKDA
jgi:hypothetical protein